MTTASKTELVISAVDKATSTINAIGARLDAVVKPAADLHKALGKLYDATGLGAVQSAVGSLKDNIIGLGQAVIGIGGVYAGTIGSVLMFANHAAEAADKIGDLSARYHIASKDLQVYGSLMEEAGAGSVDDAAASLGKLQKAMNEALHGGKEQAAAFQGIGISLEQLRGMKPDQVILRMADAFKGSERDLQKNAVLLQLMGRNGNAWMGIMDQGAASISERYAQMTADGRIFSDEQLQQADTFDKSWRRLQGTIEGIKNMFGLQLANALTSVIDKVQQWGVANRQLMQGKFDKFLQALPGVLDTATEALSALWAIAEKVGSVFKLLSAVLGPVGSMMMLLLAVFSPMLIAVGQLFFSIGKVVWVFGQMTGILPAVGTALRVVWAAMMANPIAMLVTAIIGLAVVVYENWDKIFTYVSDAWVRIKGVFDVNFFDGLIQVWIEAWQGMANGILGIIKTILPESILPEALNNMNFTFAADRAQRLTADRAAAQRTEVGGVLRVQIEGAPARVTELKKAGRAMDIDVSAGLAMVGS